MKTKVAARVSTDWNWRRRAACRDEDPELWFPVGTGPLAQRQIAQAKALCRRCPVRDECRADAAPYGIWGGTTEDERDAARRQRS